MDVWKEHILIYGGLFENMAATNQLLILTLEKVIFFSDIFINNIDNIYYCSHLWVLFYYGMKIL